MTIGEWINTRSSSETESESATLVAANFLDEDVIGNEGESKNTPVAQFEGGEVILNGKDSECRLTE